MEFLTTASEAAELREFGISTYSELRRHVHMHTNTCLRGLFKRVSTAFKRTASA